jgi:hypothetical protein
MLFVLTGLLLVRIEGAGLVQTKKSVNTNFTSSSFWNYFYGMQKQ